MEADAPSTLFDFIVKFLAHFDRVAAGRFKRQGVDAEKLVLVKEGIANMEVFAKDHEDWQVHAEKESNAIAKEARYKFEDAEAELREREAKKDAAKGAKITDALLHTRKRQ